MHVIFLKEIGTYKRVVIREGITKQIVSQYTGGAIEATCEVKSLLARLVSLIYFGDRVSLYLAILDNINPEPVAIIDYLKYELLDAEIL